MYWRINLCIQLITVSSSVLVLKTDYTCNICLRFEHGLSPNTLFIFSFHFYYLHSTLHLLTFVIAYYFLGITSVLR